MIKEDLLKAIEEDLNKSLSYFDILSVVSLTIDELKKEILDKKSIRILNFGKFNLKTFRPKMTINVRTGERILTKPYTSLRFYFSNNIMKILKSGDK